MRNNNNNWKHHRRQQTVLVLLILIALTWFVQSAPTTTTSSSSSLSPSNKNSGLLNTFRKFFHKRRQQRRQQQQHHQQKGTRDSNMGQVIRIMTYDRATNEKNAISALNILSSTTTTTTMDNNTIPLQWHRLDDGVMGGLSESIHTNSDNILHFKGTINTNGGGFCSIRAPIPNGLPNNTKAIRLYYQGDGKTYKFLLSDGNKSKWGPTMRSPSWQANIPTTNIIDPTTTITDETNNENKKEECITIPLSTFVPSFGGSPASRPSNDEISKLQQPTPENFQEIGIMLSLKLSDGTSNPIETFGEGIFPFSLKVRSIEPITTADDDVGKK